MLFKTVHPQEKSRLNNRAKLPAKSAYQLHTLEKRLWDPPCPVATVLI